MILWLLIFVQSLSKLVKHPNWSCSTYNVFIFEIKSFYSFCSILLQNKRKNNQSFLNIYTISLHLSSTSAAMFPFLSLRTKMYCFIYSPYCIIMYGCRLTTIQHIFNLHTIIVTQKSNVIKKKQIHMYWYHLQNIFIPFKIDFKQTLYAPPI